eukprot:ctg_325.g76
MRSEMLGVVARTATSSSIAAHRVRRQRVEHRGHHPAGDAVVIPRHSIAGDAGAGGHRGAGAVVHQIVAVRRQAAATAGHALAAAARQALAIANDDAAGVQPTIAGDGVLQCHRYLIARPHLQLRRLYAVPLPVEPRQADARALGHHLDDARRR